MLSNHTITTRTPHSHSIQFRSTIHSHQKSYCVACWLSDYVWAYSVQCTLGIKHHVSWHRASLGIGHTLKKRKKRKTKNKAIIQFCKHKSNLSFVYAKSNVCVSLVHSTTSYWVSFNLCSTAAPFTEQRVACSMHRAPLEPNSTDRFSHIHNSISQIWKYNCACISVFIKMCRVQYATQHSTQSK